MKRETSVSSLTDHRCHPAMYENARRTRSTPLLRAG